MKTKVKNVMTPNPRFISSDATLREAAQLMESIDCGVLPVGDETRPEGMITDRDIVIRAISRGKDVNHEKVRDYMTPQVIYINEDETLEQAARLMGEHQVNRLMVRDERDRMCGIMTFGCILRKDSDMKEISEVVETALGRYAA
jgi:CBS domain-containing protein